MSTSDGEAKVQQVISTITQVLSAAQAEVRSKFSRRCYDDDCCVQDTVRLEPLKKQYLEDLTALRQAAVNFDQVLTPQCNTL